MYWLIDGWHLRTSWLPFSFKISMFTRKFLVDTRLYAMWISNVCLFRLTGREYADPYLGHSIGPVAGYGVSTK